MTVSELKKELVSQLTPEVGAGEAAATVRLLLEDTLGVSAVDLALNPGRELLDGTVTTLRAMSSTIAEGTPVQYVLGHTSFAGLDIRVTPAVLIPRPETAELVDIICDRSKRISGLSVLDLCTGSGCIAIALARSLPFSDVTAVDNSEAALDVARDNARRLNLSIGFRNEDVLHLATASAQYDIIVSNPPYVAISEKSTMDKRVYEYEPAAALFVPDSDPLLFYRAIASYALDALKSGGTLYFEINPLFADHLLDMLTGLGWTDVDIVRDFRGQNRFAVCRR